LVEQGIENPRVGSSILSLGTIQMDEMVRGVYIDRSGAERLLFTKALDRYLSQVSSTKRASTAYSEGQKSKALRKFFGPYSLAAITPDLVANYRDERLQADKSNDTVRLELALLSHLFTVAIKEWRLGLDVQPGGQYP
jgi:hypothetical protein